MAGAAVVFFVEQSFGGQRRHHGWLEDGDHHNEQEVQANQQQTWNEGARVHVAHRAAKLVSQHDQHQRRRYGLGQGAGSRDGPGGNGPAVAVAQHHGQRNQAHGNHCSRHHAGGGRQQGADQDHGDGHATAHRAKHLADGFQQVLGHAGSLQNDAHEGEEGDGQQGVVLHDAEDAQGQCLEHGGGENARLNTDKTKGQADSSQAEGHRKAGQQHGKKPYEHERHKLLRQKSGLHLFVSGQQTGSFGFKFFEVLLLVRFAVFAVQNIGPFAS